MITICYLSRVCFAIRTTVPVPVFLQRSLNHSNSARFSQTIIHSALFKGLNEKRPDPSNNHIGDAARALFLRQGCVALAVYIIRILLAGHHFVTGRWLSGCRDMRSYENTVNISLFFGETAAR